MIQSIGIMIAFYIFARYAEMFENKKLLLGIRIYCGVSSIITIFCLLGLLSSSDSSY